MSEKKILPEKPLAEMFAKLAYKEKEAAKLNKNKETIDITELTCPDTHIDQSIKDNLPICRHGKTFCPTAYNPKAIQTCPTRLIYAIYKPKEES